MEERVTRTMLLTGHEDSSQNSVKYRDSARGNENEKETSISADVPTETTDNPSRCWQLLISTNNKKLSTSALC
jgi:hypothetical protein